MKSPEGEVVSELFDKRGGFRKLHTFTLATIIRWKR